MFGRFHSKAANEQTVLVQSGGAGRTSLLLLWFDVSYLLETTSAAAVSILTSTVMPSRNLSLISWSLVETLTATS